VVKRDILFTNNFCRICFVTGVRQLTDARNNRCNMQARAARPYGRLTVQVNQLQNVLIAFSFGHYLKQKFAILSIHNQSFFEVFVRFIV